MSAEILSSIYEILEDGLHGFQTPAPEGTMRGLDFYGEGFIMKLIETARQYKRLHKRTPNLIAPKLFSEKLMLHQFFAPLPIPAITDKLLATKYIPDAVGDFVILKSAIWQSPNSTLPMNSEIPAGDYYLKMNYGAGRNMRVQFPLSDTARTEIEKTTTKWFKSSHGPNLALWWNEIIDKQIFLEPAINSDPNEDVQDCKLLVFKGQVRVVFVKSMRGKAQFYFPFNADGDPIPYAAYHPRGKEIPPPPQFENIIKAAALIGQGFDHIRVDFFILGEAVYYAELGLPIAGGIRPFKSAKFDAQLGESWTPTWLENA